MYIEKSIYSNILKENRKYRISLPEHYDKNKAYPVLILQDGNNLFFDHESYSKVSWKVLETQKEFEKEGLEIIIIGVDNTINRLNEYSPWKNVFFNVEGLRQEFGGDGEKYDDFIFSELLGELTKEYQFSDYYLGGSSLGALISVYSTIKHQDKVKGALVISLASWVNEEEFRKFLLNNEINKELIFFISLGDSETLGEDNLQYMNRYYDSSVGLFKILLKKEVKKIDFRVYQNAKHTEYYWNAPLKEFLNLLNKKK